jgi:hypothetical protein
MLRQAPAPAALDMPRPGAYARACLNETNRDGFKSFCSVMEPAWGCVSPLYATSGWFQAMTTGR